jgi:hypothetical protein
MIPHLKTGFLFHLTDNNTVIWATLWPDTTGSFKPPDPEGELPSHLVPTATLFGSSPRRRMKTPVTVKLSREAAIMQHYVIF